MNRKIVSILLGCLIPLGLLAGEIPLKPGHPQHYVVKKGDTLWDIAGRFLQNPWQWSAIWQANKHIKDPHLIYPGDQLGLVMANGQAQLQLSRSQRSGSHRNKGLGRGEGRGRSQKLSPQMRVATNEEPIPPIPLDAIQPFLTRPRVVAPGQLEQSAYILTSQDQHMVSGKDHRIYVRGPLAPNQTNYTIFRQGGEYYDPESGQILGYEAIHVGDARIERFGDPATAMVTNSTREILAGDRLMPVEESTLPEFIPHAPTGSLAGRIISVMGGLNQVGQYQTVVLNLGRQDGIDAGHVLAIHQSNQWERDTIGGAGDWVELPQEHIGEVMVFRTFDQLSYALVMETKVPVRVYDSVATP